jgi:hypothetical protein
VTLATGPHGVATTVGGSGSAGGSVSGWSKSKLRPMFDA